jgi:hypothetical protein
MSQRCCFRLKESPKCVSIDAQPNHQIGHAFRLGEAQRTADKPRDPRAESDVFALDFLRIDLAHFVLLGVDMSLRGPPAIGITSA